MIFLALIGSILLVLGVVILYKKLYMRAGRKGLVNGIDIATQSDPEAIRDFFGLPGVRQDDDV